MHHSANLAAMPTLCHNRRMTRHRPLPALLRAQLYQHLAAMEKAGLPPDRAYALLDLGRAGRERVAAFRKLAARRSEPAGAGLASGLFSVFEARLLRAAFAAGSPLATYQRLADFHATRAQQLATLRSRMVLPVAILTIALFVQPLPALAGGTLSGGAYLWRVLSPLLALGGATLLAARAIQWFGSGSESPARAGVEGLLLALPVFGPMHVRRNLRDFVDSLALLLDAGLPLFDAMPVALQTVGNRLVRADLEAMLPTLTAGATLAQAIETLRLPDTGQLHALVLTGEQSGTLPEMLRRHAASESETINRFQLEMMAWLPRVFYALVALWMALSILGSSLGAVAPV
ncbi:type II secretion system protein [Massilia sp. CCM 8694]|uniref:Type II secretion system protein n=2 Tax=Massilia genomosp. 1 TaxID=2609280 RepID=A0ABX0MVJ7_9BURK|nr:type II secretion system protein [Massilia genomosp. 1]